MSLEEVIQKIFQTTKTIAVVGLSSKPHRPSYGVAEDLQQAGYRIIPVNPNEQEVLGEKAYPDLKSIPSDIPIDLVDIFRRSELVPPIVDEAIDREVKVIWMQDGVIHEEAAAKARAAGITVIMNDCMARWLGRLKRQGLI